MPTKSNAHVYTITAVDLRRLLAPVMPFAEATKFGIPVMNAVHLTSADGYLVARATDRYVMAFQRVPVQTAKPGLAFTLPLDAAKSMLSLFKPARSFDPEVTLTFEGDSVHVTATGGFALMDSGEASWAGVGGEYPHIKKVLAEASVESVESIALNPALMAKFATAQAAQVTPRGPMLMRFGGPGKPATIAIGDDFLGMIQPLRGDGEITVWADSITEAPEPKRSAA